MKTNLDALLTALYVFIDGHVAPCRRIGRPPKLTDAELLCLAVAQVLLGFPSARHWIRASGVAAHPGPPRQVGMSAVAGEPAPLRTTV